MKILHLIQKNQLRGVELFTCQLATMQMAMGHSVLLVTLEDSDKNDLPIREIRSAAILKTKFIDWSGLRRLKKIIQEFRPDVVQCNAADTVKYGALCGIFGKSPNAKLIYRNASMVSGYIRHPLKRFINQLWVNRMDGVASVSNHSATDFVEVYNLSSSKIRVIPIGVGSINVQQNGFTLPSLPSEYLVHVGGFTFEKNHFGLIDIYKKLNVENPQLKLVLVGDGPLRSDIELYTERQGLTEQVLFLGFQKQAMQLIKQARALLLPSKIEGLPGVILEAFLMKTPVIAYNVGGISEVVRDGETGMLIDVNIPDQFVEACLKVLGDKELESKLTINAQQLVLKEYDNRVIAKKFLSFYQELMDLNTSE